jgi:mono/diheme cytochrome c family protein
MDAQFGRRQKMQGTSGRRSPDRRKRFVAVLLLFTWVISAILISPAGWASELPKAHASSGGKQTGAADATVSVSPGANLRRGERLFLRDCAHCHGKKGDGNSPVRRTLHPKPLDLRNFELTDSFILHVLHEGVPGSDMPAWPVSAEDDLRAVAAYTVRLAHPDKLPTEDSYAPPDALEEAGRRVYAVHCSRCHGTSGNGDGPDATRYKPSPPSFRGMRPSFPVAKTVIESGVPGTAMSSWPLLTAPEIQAVTFYIRSFYTPGSGQQASTTGGQP